METGITERRRVIDSLIARISEKTDIEHKVGTTGGGTGVLGTAAAERDTRDDVEIRDRLKSRDYDDGDGDMLGDVRGVVGGSGDSGNDASRSSSHGSEVGCDGDGSRAEELREMLQIEMRGVMADTRRVELAAIHAQYRSGEIRREMRRKSAEMASIREARGQLLRRKDMLAQ
ncbi:unnamed protein product [Closterium sp. Yama58-4]|nr:unnamed protein product [Closterium sp. Yama58-4]